MTTIAQILGCAIILTATVLGIAYLGMALIFVGAS